MNKIIAIAIDIYDDTSFINLKNCKSDINALVNVLSDLYHFDDIIIYTQKEQTTLSFIHSNLYDIFINSIETDNILLLFAGHGEFNSTIGSSYWLCSDSKKNDLTSWFNLNDLLKFFNASSAKHIALISDSCFSGSIFELKRGGGSKALEGKISRQALTSGGIEKVSDGVETSPFNQVLVNVLNDNRSDLLSFTQLAEKTILNFSEIRSQTPAFGSLSNSGDQGGSFFLKTKENKSKIFTSLNLPLKIDHKLKIDSSIEVPFFNKNEFFDHDFINTYTTSFGYEIINDIRNYIEDHYHMANDSSDFYIEVGYTIQSLNEKFLSIVFGRTEYLGGAHPNHYLYGLNFTYYPERKISLFDLLDTSFYVSNKSFLIDMVTKYARKVCKKTLLDTINSEYFHHSDLSFYFTDKYFTICFSNILSHAFKACSELEIPMQHIKFKI